MVFDPDAPLTVLEISEFVQDSSRGRQKKKKQKEEEEE